MMNLVCLSLQSAFVMCTRFCIMYLMSQIMHCVLYSRGHKKVYISFSKNDFNVMVLQPNGNLKRKFFLNDGLQLNCKVC